MGFSFFYLRPYHSTHKAVGGKRTIPYSKTLGFLRFTEKLVSLGALWALEGQACCPVTAHVGGDLHAVSARCVGAF